MLQHIKLYSVPLTSHVSYYFQTFRHIISYVDVFFMTYSIWLITIHTSGLTQMSFPLGSFHNCQDFFIHLLSGLVKYFFLYVSTPCIIYIRCNSLQHYTFLGTYQYLSLNYNCSGTVWVMFALYFQYLAWCWAHRTFSVNYC